METALSSTVPASVVTVYGTVGNDLTLPKSKDGTDGSKTYVTWFFGTERTKVMTRNTFGREVAEMTWKDRLSLSGNDYSLIIKEIKQEEFGVFTCVLKEPLGTIITTTVYELYSVHVTPAPRLLAGNSLSLSCVVQASQSGARPQFRWLDPRGRDVAKDSRGQGATGQTLTVGGVTGLDHGQWTCVVMHGGRETRAKTAVTVVDLSPGLSHPYYTSVSSNRLRIPCSLPPSLSWNDLAEAGFQGGHWSFASSLFAGAPQRLFSLSPGVPPTWQADTDRGLTLSDLGKNNLSLQRNRVGEDDRGEYTCALEFKDGVTLTRTVRVEVLQILALPFAEVRFGQQVNLSCSLGHALPSDLEVKWIPPHQPSPWIRPASPAHHLTILEAGAGDQGHWSCELWRNQTKVASGKTKLTIGKELLSVWLLVTICASSVILILLLILTGILVQRHKQWKMLRRRPKRRFCRCTNPKPRGFYRT